MSQPAFLPEAIYHVYTHANGFENLFNSDINYRHFLKKYAEYIHPIAETYAYCLMPNHLHLMIEIRSEAKVLEYLQLKRNQQHLQGSQNLGGVSKIVSQQFSNLFNAYTKAINKQLTRKGSLFTPNFKRKEVTEDKYITHLVAYIHSNPVHHGFVKQLRDWPYSSFHAYISEKPTMIDREYMYEWFGGKERFIDFHQRDNFPSILLFDEF